MTKYVRALLMAATGMATVGTAAAQTLPNYGNYESLKKTFRVGIDATIFGTQGNVIANAQRAFEQDDIDGIIDYIDPAEIAQEIGPQAAQFASITGIFDIRGANGIASYNQGSPVLTVRVVNDDGSTFVNKNGDACAFTYNGQTRQDSFDQFDSAVDDENSPTSRTLTTCLTGALVRNSPVDPLAGNPASLQSSLARSSLDFTSGDSLIEEMGPDGSGANSAGDPWIIGATAGFGNAGRFDITKIDARIARGFRVFEGGRARLKFDLPFSYTRINGTPAYTAQVGLGLEVPVSPNFSIEPRVAYGATGSAQIGQVGHILQGSIAGRYVLYGVGRGRIVLGAMGGYSQTLGTPFTDVDLDPGLKNGVFRGGGAYETPLNMRVGGRLTSLRASYTFTQYTGNDLYNNNFHEFGLSLGLRPREEQVRALRDVVRFNVATIRASGFEQYTVGFGFRF
jgi:hypothetical protein